MTEELKALRAAAKAELEQPGDARDVSPGVDELLDAFFSSVTESDPFGAALEVLAEEYAWEDAPAGRAAESARGMSVVAPRNVVETLGAPRPRARGAIEQTLEITPDAADLLLDRPAAALLSYPPERVRRLADLCQKPPGEVLASIAASSRASGGYVYGYRPGSPPTAPAKRVAQTEGTSTRDWGLRFLGVERPS